MTTKWVPTPTKLRYRYDFHESFNRKSAQKTTSMIRTDIQTGMVAKNLLIWSSYQYSGCFKMLREGIKHIMLAHANVMIWQDHWWQKHSTLCSECSLYMCTSNFKKSSWCFATKVIVYLYQLTKESRSFLTLKTTIMDSTFLNLNYNRRRPVWTNSVACLSCHLLLVLGRVVNLRVSGQVG